MKCKCGFENVDGAVFCAECGATLDNGNVEQTKAVANGNTSGTGAKSNTNNSAKNVQNGKGSANRTVVVIAIAFIIIALIAAAVVVIVVKGKNDGGSSNNSVNDNYYMGETADYYNGGYENSNGYEYNNNNYYNYTQSNEHTYEVIKMDCSWTQAMNECKNKGGHLATISSVEEYNKICNLADQVDGLKYIWLGAQVNAGSTNWSNAWITGENWTFEKWYQNEPSGYDSDGTVENCLCMWNVKQNGTYIGWTFNDQRNDLVSALPTISGKVGFVCEYE